MKRLIYKKPAVAIIGAGYGDEGKGLMTDAQAEGLGADATIIRFNSGAQAGHTVTLPDGRSHIFHHVGSGAATGAKTFLSKDFVANPILFHREIADLKALGFTPDLAIDPDATITLPQDMMINQIIERARGNARHGSCGVGFGETVERSLHEQFVLRAGDIGAADNLMLLLRRVTTTWVPRRLERLGVKTLSAEDRELLASPEIAVSWIKDVLAFREQVKLLHPSELRAHKFIFEGAQGLGLDQDRGAFPHVTRSNTGLRNVMRLASEMDLAQLDIIYMTRAYVTRHGAGPLAHELSQPPAPYVVDITNQPNAWQGNLRFATLDIGLLSHAIKSDLGDAAAAPFSSSVELAMTCLDQMEEKTEFWRNGQLFHAATAALPALAAQACNANGHWESWGSSRLTLKHSNIGVQSSNYKAGRAINTTLVGGKPSATNVPPSSRMRLAVGV
jgi:adenylosuccinate synthase